MKELEILIPLIGKPVWIVHDMREHWDVLKAVTVDEHGLSYRFISGLDIPACRCSIYEKKDLK